MADLSKEKSQEPFIRFFIKNLIMVFYWVYLYRNAGHICKAHQPLSGSKDQIIDNIQRTMRAYSESGSDS